MDTVMSNGKSNKGFTLIEVIIVVAIVGLLVAVAVPAYNSFITKTRRGDAMVILQEVAGEQERFLSENNRYAADLAELGYGNATNEPSPEGYYTITSDQPTAITSYVLTATPVTGGPQANDADCGSFTLDSAGVKGISGTADVATCW